MTRLTPILTSLKTLNITYQTPQETLLSTPETLPTSEPATPQIGYTVQGSRLPSLSYKPYQAVYVALVFGAGKFVTTGTLYWNMKKNGVSVTTGSGTMTANYYYTLSAFFFDVNVGDVLELALWSSVTNSNWDYKALAICVSRIIPFAKIRILAPVTIADFVTYPILTLGNPGDYSTSALYPLHDDYALPSITTTRTYDCLYCKSNGLFRVGSGDYSYANTVQLRQSSSTRPYYYRNYLPTRISLRGVRTEGQI